MITDTVQCAPNLVFKMEDSRTIEIFMHVSYSVCFFLRMIRSSFKSENLVIMQIFTASSFWPETYDLSVHCTLYGDTVHHILCHETQNTVSFYSAFMFLLESMKASSVVEKTLSKSFQTSDTFLGGSKYQTSNDVVYPQFKFRNKLSSTLSLKDREFP